MNNFTRRAPELEAAIAREGVQPDAALAGVLASSARSTPSSRKLAAERLVVLDRVGLLTPAGKDSLVELLWETGTQPAPACPLALGSTLGRFLRCLSAARVKLPPPSAGSSWTGREGGSPVMRCGTLRTAFSNHGCTEGLSR